MNMRMNSIGESPDVPMKENIKMHVTLSMSCDIENLPEIKLYLCSQFTEVSNATDYDGASRHSKGAG